MVRPVFRALPFSVVLMSMVGAALSAEVADKALTVPAGQVRLTGWLGQRVDANHRNRLMKVGLDERLRPFEKPSEQGGWSGEHIGKWLHAASISWGYTRDPGLRKRMDEAAARLIAAQAADGYLGTYSLQHRWTGWDVWTHKYNLIGLLSYHEISSDAKTLEAARKIGDLLVNTFGEGKRDIVRSGEHVGMAATSVLEPIVLLYRATKDPRYLEFARYIVRSYDQPHGPKIVRSLSDAKSVVKTANGKAYEMMSNLVGLCELYRSTGDEALLRPCVNAYNDIMTNQLYVTGGTSLGEHFQPPHRLPNTGAVSENCAHVTWLQLCAELLRITGEAKYADTLELTIYNHLLASQKPSGESLCYFTPLAGKKPYDAGTNCCTSSGPRGIALASTLVYTTGPKAVMVNFYEPSTLRCEVDGRKLRIVQATRYPLDGKIHLAINPDEPVQFDLCLRIPGWCKRYTLSVNGKKVAADAAPRTFCRLSQRWMPGDVLLLELDMPAVLIEGTDTNAGLIALRRGPLVLAFDSRLNPGLTPNQVSPLVGQVSNLPTPGQSANPSTPSSSAATAPALPAHLFQCEGLTREPNSDALKKVPLRLTSFAEAGQTGSTFAVWMPSPERLQKVAASPFLGAKETWSRPGNVEGSIADGDLSTYRVTFDGHKQAEAWFAVERATPVEIDSVLFAHGHTFHDGGWWDASREKPRVQVRKTAGGAWEDVGPLAGYPDTTATNPKGLSDGKEFITRFAPVEVVGIRVIGVPACGDGPQQAFASCAELQGMLEKGKQAAPARPAVKK